MSGYSRIERISANSQPKIENRLTVVTPCGKRDVMPLFLEFCQKYLNYSLVEAESQYVQSIRTGHIEEVKDIAYRMQYLKSLPDNSQ